MEIELTTVAAMVSHIPLGAKGETHTVFKILSEVCYEVVQMNVPGVATAGNTFSNATSEEEAENAFWKLYRSGGCHQYVLVLVSILQKLADHSFTIVHDGSRLSNIMVINTMALDVSDIISRGQEPTVVVPGAMIGERKDVELPLYSTYHNVNALAKKAAIRKAHAFLGRGVFVEVPKKKTQDAIASLTGTAPSGLVPHWWICAFTKNQKMVHVDLCAIAYGLPSCKLGLDVDSGLFHCSPVHVFETSKYMLAPHPQESSFPHKMIMTNQIWPSILRERPSELHFKHVSKSLHLEVTPLPEFLQLHQKKNKKEPVLARLDELVDKFTAYFVTTATIGTGIVTTGLQNLSFNDKKGRIVKGDSYDPSRVAVLLEGKEDPVKVKSQNLRFGRISCTPQVLSLQQLKDIVKEETTYSFIPNQRVTVSGLSSEAGIAMNEQSVTIIKMDRIGNSPASTRWIVALSNGRTVSLPAKNLGHQAASQMSRGLATYLAKDPIAVELMYQMRLGNSGFTTLADPKFRPAVIRMLQDGSLLNPSFRPLIEHHLAEKMRLLMLKMKRGLSPNEYSVAMEEPGMAEFYDQMVANGLIKPRLA